jgi:micrococcal nuclease
MMRAAVALAILIGLPRPSLADAIPSAQAKDHIGETATVCGRVADTLYQETGSHVTFLNFDKPYPSHTFTAFLPAENRSKFGTPEKDYKDKDICVTGKIENYRGKPEIVLTDPQQIKVQAK